MPRLFIAIDLPQAVRESLRHMTSPLARVRPVPVEQLHLTLKFLGEIDGTLALDVRDALQTVSLPPFTMQLKGCGVFPPRGNPRVLWVGIHPLSEVTQLYKRIETKLAQIQVPKEKRKFSPHITLARLPDSPVRFLPEFLAGNSLFSSPTFTVDSFTLYSSRLTPKGAIHTPLASYLLAQGSTPLTPE